MPCFFTCLPHLASLPIRRTSFKLTINEGGQATSAHILRIGSKISAMTKPTHTIRQAKFQEQSRFLAFLKPPRPETNFKGFSAIICNLLINSFGYNLQNSQQIINCNSAHALSITYCCIVSCHSLERHHRSMSCREKSLVLDGIKYEHQLVIVI